MINVKWGSFAETLGFLLSEVVLFGVPSALIGLGFWGLGQWIRQEEVSKKLFTSLVDYAFVIPILLGLISFFVIAFNMESITDFCIKLFSGRVRVYLNGRLVASGKANVYFYVPLSRPGDIYEVKWGRETFSLRLYPRTHYTISKGDFGWGYRD